MNILKHLNRSGSQQQLVDQKYVKTRSKQARDPRAFPHDLLCYEGAGRSQHLIPGIGILQGSLSRERATRAR